MKKLIITISMVIIGTSCYSQKLNPDTFSFWLGKWNASWTDANGTQGGGTNSISLTTGDKVLHENFHILKGTNVGYKGTSISVFNPNTKVWHQTWMDNQGGNIIFTGDTEGDKRIFKTAIVEQNGKQVQSRMVFYNIEKDSFMWDWEQTTDGGLNWKLNWRINYTRLK